MMKVCKTRNKVTQVINCDNVRIVTLRSMITLRQIKEQNCRVVHS